MSEKTSKQLIGETLYLDLEVNLRRVGGERKKENLISSIKLVKHPPPLSGAESIFSVPQC